MDVKKTFEDFEDYLAPKLDTYEQAIYLYVFRHSRLQGRDDVLVGFKSARKEMAFGIGERGKPMSEGTCYEKLRSLEQKGCVRILASEHKGTRVEVKLPAEIPGIVPVSEEGLAAKVEEEDFFTVSDNRTRIFLREGGRCFYCLRVIDSSTFVIEHVENRRTGGNGYRNVVAACRSCNNRKNDSTAAELLRQLYRSALLSEEEFAARTAALQELSDGQLKPPRRSA
jgi:HNH endonuclease